MVAVFDDGCKMVFIKLGVVEPGTARHSGSPRSGEFAIHTPSAGLWIPDSSLREAKDCWPKMTLDPGWRSKLGEANKRTRTKQTKTQ